ncbi:(3,5-dihydroxyphenyl)acetyl-CoA 1,2-dioxygenase DpgC [Streptomyces sp. NPDC055107]
MSREREIRAQALAELSAEGEAALARLPEPARRSAVQRDAARQVHSTSRRARSRFLADHAEEVYDLLTDGKTGQPRLGELLSSAAREFAGLVPTTEQMAVEQGRSQAGKEGREIDQGLFFGGLLRAREAGEHLIASMLAPTSRALDLAATFEKSGSVALEKVGIERVGHTAQVTISNPDCLNAEDNGLVRDLETAIDLVALDGGSRVGVLRGGVMSHPKYAGSRVFSSGINLKDLHLGRISYVDFLLGRELGCVNKLLHGVRTGGDGPVPDGTTQKPWIGVVDTFAIGGGFQLLLVLDQVIAVEGAYLSLPAAQEGIVPGLANLRLSRFAGGRLTRQMILGGRRIPAGDPSAARLIDEVVPAEDVAAAVERAADALATPAVVDNRRMLVLAEEPVDSLRAYLAEFAVVQARRLYAEDVLTKVALRGVRE